jgi:protein TonB
MPGLHVVLAISIAALAFPGRADQGAGVPAGEIVSLDAQGLTPPALVKEVKPSYTAEAMRARIQGVVGLECVIETDGRVGDATVTRSLDAVHGLDAQAIKAVKQWRFKPAMRDGKPVRTAVSIELSFTLRDPATPVPINGWPDSFANVTESAGIPTGWTEHAIDVPTLRLKVAYPPGWSLLEAPNPNTLASLSADDGRGHRTISILPPVAVPYRLERPLPTGALSALLEGVARMQIASAPDATMLRSGQVKTPERLWLWLESSAPTTAGPGTPPAVARHLEAAHDGVRLWTFVTTAGNQSVMVSCYVMHMKGAAEAEREDEVRNAAIEFGSILRRLSITEVQK